MFTEQEKQIITFGKANGKTRQEVEQALIRLRTGQKPKVVEPAKPSFGEIIKGDITDIRTGFQERVEKDVSIPGQVAAFGKAAVETFGLPLRIAGQAISAVTPEPVKEAVKTGIAEAFKNTVLGSFLQTDTGQQLIEKVQQASEEHPAITDVLVGTLEGIGTLLGYKGLGELPVLVKSLSKQVGEVVVKPAIEAGEAVVEKVGKAVVPSAESIMQRVARIPKGAQAKFESLAGESVGKYLETRGVYGEPEKIVNQLFERFNVSKNAADESLAKLQGNFKTPVLKTALDELLAKETAKSTPGALSKDLQTVMQLKNKLAREGLTMEETNIVKRLYERNVKLDYVKQNLPTETARANNIDSAIRKFQFDEAEHQGLQNLPAINKETQLAKQLIDALGKEQAGLAGNNAITLTDWILLSGGSPEAISGFFVKKLLSSKAVQSWFASKIGKQTVGMPEAIFGEPKLTITDFLKSIEDSAKRTTPPR